VQVTAFSGPDWDAAKGHHTNCKSVRLGRRADSKGAPLTYGAKIIPILRTRCASASSSHAAVVAVWRRSRSQPSGCNVVL
jgi:hypothetical protein